jgi:hypothetical protein
MHQEITLVNEFYKQFSTHVNRHFPTPVIPREVRTDLERADLFVHLSLAGDHLARALTMQDAPDSSSEEVADRMSDLIKNVMISCDNFFTVLNFLGFRMVGAFMFERYMVCKSHGKDFNAFEELKHMYILPDGIDRNNCELFVSDHVRFDKNDVVYTIQHIIKDVARTFYVLYTLDGFYYLTVERNSIALVGRPALI